MASWLKAELHCHTRDDPVDGQSVVRHSHFDLIDQAKKQNFQVLSITNHQQMLRDSEVVEYAKKQNILLLPGVEANIEGKHVLLYNFANYSSQWSTPEIVQKNKQPENLVIAPHPFFPSSNSLGKKLLEWEGLFDAVEYNHFYLKWLNFNQRAKRAALNLNLPLVGNSDVHHLFQLGRTYSLIYAEKTVESVLTAIRKGKVRIVSQPVNLGFVSGWFFRTLSGQSRQACRDLVTSVFLPIGAKLIRYR